MKIKKLFPQFKSKAFIFSYDDGVEQDKRFIALLDRYHFRATFNLNSGLEDFIWKHDCGLDIRRMNMREMYRLYDEHEIASHTVDHPYMDYMSDDGIRYQLGHDKYQLEMKFNRHVSGFAVPFHYYDDRIKHIAMEMGFEYSRCSNFSYSFHPFDDFYQVTPTIFHKDDRLFKLLDQFYQSEEELPIFLLVGHTYDFDVYNNWDMIEKVMDELSKHEDVINLTTIEAVKYMKAMNDIEIIDDQIINHSDIDLYFEIDGKPVLVKAV